MDKLTTAQKMKLKKLPLDLFDYYTCQVEYESGWEEHGADFSVNKPHPELGRPLQIMLKPADDDLPVVRMTIPEGTQPVFKKRRMHYCGDMTYFEELKILCGWVYNNSRTMKQIDMRTGKKSTVIENIIGKN